MGINAQVQELRDAFDTLQTEVGAAAQRVLDKLAAMQATIESLGEMDPDVQDQIDEIKSETEKIKSIAAEPAPEPEPEPEPTPEP